LMDSKLDEKTAFEIVAFSPAISAVSRPATSREGKLREALDKASEALLQGADWMDEKGHMAQCNWLQGAYDRARSALSEQLSRI